MATLHPVILAGGSGTRLWPMSREPNETWLARTILNGGSKTGGLIGMVEFFPLGVTFSENRFPFFRIAA